MTASIPSLGERLRWAGGGHGEGREAAERAGMARAGFYLLAVGGVLALVSLALPTNELRNVTAIFVTATIALALSLVPLIGFDRLPVTAFELLASAGTLLVSSALWFGGTDGYELFYFWVALYAAYFLRPRRVVGQLTFIVSCYGLVEFGGPGQSITPVHWLVASGTLFVAAGLVVLLKANLVGSIERLEALIEASPLASIELDSDGRVRGWNGAAETLLGWRFDEVVGRPLPVEASGEEDGLLLDMVRSGPAYIDHQLTCTRKSGEVFDAALHTAPVGHGDGLGGGHIVLLADTSARKELDQRLAHASKMESIGRLAGGIAHDFNNLLLVMRSHASLLRERLGDIVVTELDEVERAADDAGRLVRQLLAFSRNRDVEPTILDADVVLARVESMLRPLMHEDIELVRTPSVVPPTALADPTQVELIVVNLALNARDALPEGGTITVAHGGRGAGRRALGRPDAWPTPAWAWTTRRGRASSSRSSPRRTRPSERAWGSSSSTSSSSARAAPSRCRAPRAAGRASASTCPTSSTWSTTPSCPCRSSRCWTRMPSPRAWRRC